MAVVYLDNNATTKVDPEVLEAMLPYFSDYYGNPSSMHAFGGEVAGVIREARARLAQLLGARPEEIVFTSCGTESDNTAIRAAIESYPTKRHLLTSRVEHPAVKNLFETLAKKGYRVTFVPVDAEGAPRSGLLRRPPLGRHRDRRASCGPTTRRGCCSRSRRSRARSRSAASSSTRTPCRPSGKCPSTWRTPRSTCCRSRATSCTRPKGIGALYVRKGTKFAPFMIGGHQEQGRRGGTENVAAIVGLGKAAELARHHLENGRRACGELRDRLERGLLAGIPNTMVNGDPANRLPNTTNIGFEYVEGEAILLMLNEHGICASSGSACTSGSLEPSHVLRAMGVPFTAAHGSIRFSLSRYTTGGEIDLVLEKLPPIIARLRELSPFWKKEGMPEGAPAKA